MTCLNCSAQMLPYFEKKDFHIRRCPSCALMAVENVPMDLAPFYSAGYFTGDVTLDGYMDYDRDKEVTRGTYVKYLDELDRVLRPSQHKTMFEVGCATGFFMKMAQEHGWQTEGIDISEYAVIQARNKGLKATATVLESYTTEQKFDCVVMEDVIEHVKDPIDAITRVRELLAEGGLFMLTTPDAGSLWARAWGPKWHAFVPPQHLFYFSVKNLSSILEKQGFTVERFAHHGKSFAIPYIIRLLYSWTGLKLFSRLAEWSSQTFLKNIAVPINVRDTIFLIARKT